MATATKAKSGNKKKATQPGKKKVTARRNKKATDQPTTQAWERGESIECAPNESE